MKTENKLQSIESFQQVLDGYTPAAETIDILQSTPLLLLVGPTASGRNTLINILTRTGRYHSIVSHTTRHPRENNQIMEQDGVEYWFVTEGDFLQGLQNGTYLEAAIIHGQQVSGISVDELKKAYNSGKIALDEIEIVGAVTIHNLKPDAVFVFLLPPTFDEWMSRLQGRGHMDDEELVRRLISAKEEITHALQTGFYHFVINNEIHEAAMAADELANGREPDPEKQNRGRNHAEQLLAGIQLYLRDK